MSYQRERDYFIAQVAPTLGVPNARALLACATTLQRLAEAQCNGDWPCDNGERKVTECPLCEGLWVPSQIQGSRLLERGEKACPDCRTEARAHQLVEGSPYRAVTQGDPRGAVLSLYERSASRESIENGTARRIYVPTR